MLKKREDDVLSNALTTSIWYRENQKYNYTAWE